MQGNGSSLWTEQYDLVKTEKVYIIQFDKSLVSKMYRYNIKI